MVMDFVEDGGKTVGAMGLDVRSATVMTFHAKAVIPADQTFDNEIHAYSVTSSR